MHKTKAKVGRKSFEKDARAYKLFLTKLAERPGFDESFCNHAIEYAYKETYRVVKPLKPHVKQRLLGFLPRYRDKIQEDLELHRRRPHVEIPAPGAMTDGGAVNDDSHSSGEESVESNEAHALRRSEHQQPEEPRRTFFNRCELDEDIVEETKRRSKSEGSSSNVENFLSDSRRRRRTNFPTVTFEDYPPTSDATLPNAHYDESASNEASTCHYHESEVDIIGNMVTNNLSLNDTDNQINREAAHSLIIKEEIDISDIEQSIGGETPSASREAASEATNIGNNNLNNNSVKRRSRKIVSRTTAVDSCGCKAVVPTTIIINTGSNSSNCNKLPQPMPADATAASNAMPLVMYTSSPSSANGQVSIAPFQNGSWVNQQAWIESNINRVSQEIESIKERLECLYSQLASFQNFAKKHLPTHSKSANRASAKSALLSRAPSGPNFSSDHASQASSNNQINSNTSNQDQNNSHDRSPNPTDNLNSILNETDDGNLLNSFDAI